MAQADAFEAVLPGSRECLTRHLAHKGSGKGTAAARAAASAPHSAGSGGAALAQQALSHVAARTASHRGTGG